MKKILIGLMFLMTSSVFADTIYVTQGNNVKVYSGLKKVMVLSENSLKDNEYTIGNNSGLLYFRYKGKLHTCSNFEIVED